MNKHERKEAVEAKHNPPWKEECDGLDDRLWSAIALPCQNCTATFFGSVCPICKREKSVSLQAELKEKP
jgi:hypothetical protein